MVTGHTVLVTGHRGTIGRALLRTAQHKYSFRGLDVLDGDDILDYDARYRAGEVISSSLAESTINQVVSKQDGEEAANALDATRRAPTPSSLHPCAQRRPRRPVPPLAPRLHPSFTHTIEGSPAGLAVAA